jgi:small-conductance mechanosensitive channel
MLGVNFTSLAVVAGGLSVGIGFGMQNIFNNLISGLMLIFGRTLLVGDFVDIGGASGTVRAISIRSTTIETVERALVYVPNSIIMAGQFTNWTRASRLVRRSVVIGVAYESDTDLVKTIMLEAAKKQDHVLQSPPPAVLFTNFGDNALEFTLNVFIDDLDYALSTLSALRFELERAFRANNIDIPFPQLTLHTEGGGSDSPAKPKLAAVKEEEPEPEKPSEQ